MTAWRRLCVWISRHPHKFLFIQHVPPDLRSLLGPEGADVRERWRAAGVLPVYLHTRYGWRLCENWQERLHRLAEQAH